MKPIQTQYLGELRTEATHTASGAVIYTDAPTDNQGKGETFSPTDLVAAALGSCMLTIMGIQAQKDGINLNGTRITTHKIMASHPRRISEIEIIFDFPKNLHLSIPQKEKLERVARLCPVSESLHPDLKQSLTFNFAESIL